MTVKFEMFVSQSVQQQYTDVSEEHFASVFSVEDSAKTLGILPPVYRWFIA
jgi:hypothetical protein